MGVVGMLAPEADGGLGLTMVDLVLILEETGRFAVPEPIVETAARGVPLLGRADVCVTIAHALVPWADTVDVIITAAGQFDRDDRRARPAPVGRRRAPAVRSARHAGRRSTATLDARRTSAACAARPRSCAGSPTACSR